MSIECFDFHVVHERHFDENTGLTSPPSGSGSSQHASYNNHAAFLLLGLRTRPRPRRSGSRRKRCENRPSTDLKHHGPDVPNRARSLSLTDTIT